MSVTYNFKINIAKNKENNLSSTDIIESLIEAEKELSATP